MPQMAPMPWTILLLVSILTLLYLSTTIFFSIKQSNSMKINFEKKNISIKW
uniref:ATP synthase complex subunit 8 n=1 Tax=Psylla alni TaxID=1393965 RepID=A0A344A2Q9_9HEMI|nr:ATP synthase F0 subunit 8 [Psylla alni]AWU49050.1 ATP synthase F0 subunit 8 [Psylla alni]